MLDMAPGVRLPHRQLPPRRRGLQDRRPAPARATPARRCGPTGGASRWKPMTRSTRISRWSTMPAPARSSIRDDANGIQRLNQEAAKALADGRRMGSADLRRGRLALAGDQSGDGARHRRPDRQPARRQAGRRGAVERQSVQRLHAAAAGLDRRRADVRHEQPATAAGQRFRARPAGRRRCEVKRLVAPAGRHRRASPPRPPPRRPSRSPAAGS